MAGELNVGVLTLGDSGGDLNGSTTFNFEAGAVRMMEPISSPQHRSNLVACGARPAMAQVKEMDQESPRPRATWTSNSGSRSTVGPNFEIVRA